MSETVTTLSNHEQFELLLKNHAPYIQAGDFQLHNDSEYAEVIQNVLDHKYLTNERIPFEITMDQALYSWHENVYYPIMQAMDEVGLPWSFPEVSRGELFLWVTRHWHFMKQEQDREVGFEEAVYDFGAKFGAGALDRLWYRVKRLVA